MADNVAITAGSGTTIAADDVGSALHQRVKLSLGADGSATDALGGAGAVAAGVQRVTLASDDPAVASLSVIDDWDSNDACKITTRGKYVDVTLGSLETSALADGDVMCSTTEVTGAFSVNDGTGVIQSIQVLDEDDEGAPFDLVFLSANQSLGTANSAPSISDANARDILGRVRVNSSDFIDIGGCRIATLTGIGLGVKAGSGVDDMWVSAICRAAAGVTYTAGTDLKLRIYIAND